MKEEEDALQSLMRAIDWELAANPREEDGSADPLRAQMGRFMEELASDGNESKEDQDMLIAISNAVESGDYASADEVFREALRDWRLHYQIHLRRVTRLKNDILPGPVEVADGNMGGYSPETILERGRQLLADRRITAPRGKEDPLMIRVFLQAIEVFGRSEKAARWLLEPLPRFEGRTALQMMGSDEGARRVEEMLVQIDEGIFS